MTEVEVGEGEDCMFATLWAAASSAPPAPPQLYQQQAPPHLQNFQNIGPIDYYVDNQEAHQYYGQPLQKQGGNPNPPPARLESLEPDSEVELIPGAQQPQQPPQQTPVAPGNGIIPGRVFIVHMPVPGYRPGTIGGYQPVYVVAAAPQGNTAYAPNAVPNGYQNAVLINPSGQVISPFFGYPGAVQQSIAPNSGLLLGAPLHYGREYEQLYQGPPGVPAYAYGPPGGPQGPGPVPRANPQGVVQLAQLIKLQGQSQGVNGPRTPAEAASSSDPKRVGEAESGESKETVQEAAPEPRRNARPLPPHAQGRNKA
ncbi:splicing factor, proline- and glutamine-rich-like [Hyposmocoma kahamanoa]|uniref:splicing factor, proline- and glutamine-rich-like n=1 Tax=Hyposmocoma kahamanoa TaxID=1477025 RepID=UPI000E6D8EAA|nr:splicing factor, proline- and glutamine-rich-like [Hyposmocoma kahamanoa]